MNRRVVASISVRSSSRNATGWVGRARFQAPRDEGAGERQHREPQGERQRSPWSTRRACCRNRRPGRVSRMSARFTAAFYSSPSSRSFRVSVFRPQPMSFAASWRRPCTRSSAASASVRSKRSRRDVEQRRAAAREMARSPRPRARGTSRPRSAAAPSPPRSAGMSSARISRPGAVTVRRRARVHELAHVAGPGEGDEAAARPLRRAASSARRRARARRARGSASSSSGMSPAPLAQRRHVGCGPR